MEEKKFCGSLSVPNVAKRMGSGFAAVEDLGWMVDKKTPMTNNIFDIHC
jgi:hypothetical protein